MGNFTKRAVLIFLSLTMIFFALQAVPAKRGLMSKEQSDGKVLKFVLKGDESSHHRETTDGFWLLENQNGDLVYALLSATGEFVESKQIAHNVGERDNEEITFLQSIDKKVYAPAARKQKANKRRAPRKLTKNEVGTLKNAGTDAKILIILVEYSDVKFSIPSVQSTISDQLNTPGYTGYNHIGSARDYFYENSLQTFDPKFEVVGPVTLSETMAYYGGNDANGDDQRAGTMVSQAALLAKDLADFSQYDLDKDGKVDNIVIIYAGYNEAEGASENTIWPHSWSLTEAVKYEPTCTIPTIDDVTIDVYACASELSGISGKNLAGIGTICHEFGHVLGLMDLYDTDYEYNGQAPGFGDFSLMDMGSSLNDGKTPPYLTAYEREILGWGTVTELINPGGYTLDNINKGQIYRINSAVPNEYYLLENRQNTRWDSELPAHGMLITHVDMTDLSYFNNNTLNAYSSRERVDLKEANGAKMDGEYYISTASDLFPGSARKSVFSDTSSPANSKLWNKSNLGKPIFNITESGGIVSFDFISEKSVIAPIAKFATDYTSNSFTANWNSVEGAQSYFVDVYSKIEGNQVVVMDQTFDGIKSASTKELASSTDWSGIGLTGWTGTKAYAGYSGAGATSNIVTNALKFGTSSTKFGNIIFPANINGTTNITISAKDWEGGSNGDGGTYTVSHDPTGGSKFQTVGTSGALEYKQFTEKTFEITGGTANSKIKIDIAGGRAFINKIAISSGTPEQRNYVAGYQNQNVGTVNSINIKDLNSDNVYYYVVRATDGTLTSANSNEIKVDLKTNGLDEINNSFNVYSSQNKLFVELAQSINIEVYNAFGQLIVTQKGIHGVNEIELQANSIYIVKLGTKTIKILL